MNGKQLEWLFKSAVMSARATLKWGTPWPRQIAPVGGVSPITINPRDKRARKKLIFDTLRHRLPRNRAFWKQAATALAPEAALDIGLNFGECLFTPRYHPRTRVFGFEANPDLQPYLADSLSRHPNREQMSLHFGIVGEKHGGEAPFHIDTQWSGMSGAVQAVTDDPDRYRTIMLPTLSVDGVLAEAGCSPRSLLFKIDVEGYEPHVLAGMAETLERLQWAVGFIEVDELSADAAQVDLPAFFEQLKSRFHVHGFNRQDKLVDLQQEGFAALDAIGRKTGLGSRKRPIYTDLVLLRGEPSAEMLALVESWS